MQTKNLKKWLDNMRDLTEDEEKACSKVLENISEEVKGEGVYEPNK